MRSSILTAAGLLVVVSMVGCGKSTVPKVEQAAVVAATEAEWTLVTLHIDGFKKSKSGGT